MHLLLNLLKKFSIMWSA